MISMRSRAGLELELPKLNLSQAKFIKCNGIKSNKQRTTRDICWTAKIWAYEYNASSSPSSKYEKNQVKSFLRSKQEMQVANRQGKIQFFEVSIREKQKLF